jgi:hypothetical protein
MTRSVRFLSGVHRRVLQAVRRVTPSGDRGDVPGWVLITVMTAGLVLGIWAVASPRLEAIFGDAMDSVVGGP